MGKEATIAGEETEVVGVEVVEGVVGEEEDHDTGDDIEEDKLQCSCI